MKTSSRQRTSHHQGTQKPGTPPMNRSWSWVGSCRHLRLGAPYLHSPIAQIWKTRSSRLAVSFAITLAMTGCHKQPRITAPPPPPVVASTPIITVPPPTHITPDAVLDQPAPPVVIPPKPRPRPRRPAALKPQAPAPQLAPAPVQTVTSLGTLSSGNDIHPEQREQIAGLVRSIHQRMDSVPTDVQATHREQFDRIRNFLKQADAAWASGDADGAQNLAVKARVLLEELQK